MRTYFINLNNLDSVTKLSYIVYQYCSVKPKKSSSGK